LRHVPGKRDIPGGASTNTSPHEVVDIRSFSQRVPLARRIATAQQLRSVIDDFVAHINAGAMHAVGVIRERTKPLQMGTAWAVLDRLCDGALVACENLLRALTAAGVWRIGDAEVVAAAVG
jgi:hypothetical protein